MSASNPYDPSTAQSYLDKRPEDAGLTEGWISPEDIKNAYAQIYADFWAADIELTKSLRSEVATQLSNYQPAQASVAGSQLAYKGTVPTSAALPAMAAAATVGEVYVSLNDTHLHVFNGTRRSTISGRSSRSLVRPALKGLRAPRVPRRTSLARLVPQGRRD